jgi:hypothetical protein
VKYGGPRQIEALLSICCTARPEPKTAFIYKRFIMNGLLGLTQDGEMCVSLKNETLEVFLFAKRLKNETFP